MRQVRSVLNSIVLGRRTNHIPTVIYNLGTCLSINTSTKLFRLLFCFLASAFSLLSKPSDIRKAVCFLSLIILVLLQSARINHCR